MAKKGLKRLTKSQVDIHPMLSYNIFENVDLSIFGNVYFGKDGTAYAKNLGNGGVLRARVYF